MHMSIINTPRMRSSRHTDTEGVVGSVPTATTRKRHHASDNTQPKH
jgi:hypothetical protein